VSTWVHRTAPTGATAILVTLVLVAGCARSFPPASPGPFASAASQPSCSASRLSPDLPSEDLPDPVASMRSRIAEAARACDFDGLERLALAGDSSFSFSFGGEDGPPGGYWRELEAQGGAPLAFLVRVLTVRHGTTELPPPEGDPGATSRPTPAASRTLYVWPAAATKEVPTDQDWAEIESIYPRDQVARMKQDTAKFGIGYLGWRAGITAPGDWIYFIEGD
jgi:hypothetical protein